MAAECGRRESLRRMAALAGSATLAQLPLGGAEADSTMPRRVLGRTGVRVSAVAFGLGPLGLGGFSDTELRSAAEAAIEEGITYFDVQWDYGDAERDLALVIKAHRSELFAVSKVWEQSRAGTVAAIRESAGRLGVAYLDAVLLNNIGTSTSIF